MFSVPASVRVFVATSPADLRRGFDGLAALTREVLEQDPLSGHLFVFRNRRGDRLKVLFFACREVGRRGARSRPAIWA